MYVCVSVYLRGQSGAGRHLQPNVKVCSIKSSSRLVNIMQDIQAVNVSVMSCVHYNAVDIMFNTDFVNNDDEK